MHFNDGDIATVLDRLNIDYDEHSNELVGRCPMHAARTGSADHNPSWSINTESGIHHCFSCGYRGILLSLIADVLDFRTSDNRSDYERAKRWLSQITTVDLEQTARKLDSVKDSYIGRIKPVPMSEARLAIFDTPPTWALEARGLDSFACEEYSVKWDDKKLSWITPVRSAIDYSLMGWQEKGQGTRYFKNRPAGIKKSTTLFGIETTPLNTVVVVESPLDVVKMASWGYYVGLSTFGARISREQLELLSSAKELVFALDNDMAGQKSLSEIRKACREYGIEYSVFNYGESTAKDIGDMTQEEFEFGLLNKEHCVLGGIKI